MTKQGEKIQAWADLAGITPRDYTGTFHAAADAIGIPPGPTDARMVTYLQRLTGSDETNLMNLEALAAKQNGADHWGALGSEVGQVLIARYLASDGTEPALVIDRKRGFYYWDGAEKSLSDMTEVVGKGYYIDDMDWYTPDAFTLSVEYATPNSVTSGEHIMSMAIPSDGSVRLGVSLNAAAKPLLQIDPTGSGYTAVESSLTTHPVMGRCRFVARFDDAQEYKVVENGMVKEDTASTAVYSSTVFTRLAVGFRQIAGTQDSVSSAGDDCTIIVWPAAISDGVMEDTAKKSPDFAAPVHILGDSIFNEDTFANGGGVVGRLKKLAQSGDYVAWSHSVAGGTNLEQFYTRYAADTEHHSANLIIGEGGLDYSGVDTLGAVQDIVGLCAGDWVIVEPIVATNLDSGTANRIAHDSAFDAIVAWAGEDRIIRTLSDLQDANDGSGTDLADIAADTIPTSLTTDGLHLNSAGQQVLAQTLYDALTARGWL